MAGPAADSPDSAIDSPDSESRQAVSAAAAAARLGVTQRTVHRMIHDGRLPSRRVQDGTRSVLRIPTDALPPLTPDGQTPMGSPDSPDSATDSEADSLDSVADRPDSAGPPPDNAIAHEALAMVREKDQQLVAANDRITQMAGQLGFLQAQVQERDATIKLLQAPPDEPAPQRRWWQWRPWRR